MRKRRLIVGPILPDLITIGLNDGDVTFATAFYSKRVLDSLPLTPRSLTFMCRLDLDNPREWIEGLIAPDALLTRLKSLEAQGTHIHLFVGRHAHAKAYLGCSGAIIGSANLTLQGFGGGWEIIQYSREHQDMRDLHSSLLKYQRTLTSASLKDLESYVSRYRRLVQRRRKRLKDTLPTPRRRPRRLGDYKGFLAWLQKRHVPAAREILQRAKGKGNLQGHIHRNFYGIRQYLIAYPEEFFRFAREDPDHYKLARDPDTEARLAAFVASIAKDEADFSLDTWKTYLPRECGGRAGKHGGTIGNLNRMLPLVARYMKESVRR